MKESEVVILIRDNIKRICREQGKTIDSLEKEAEISRGYIYNMKNPSINLLEKIAEKLNVDVCELISDNK